MQTLEVQRELPAAFYEQLSNAIESHKKTKECFEKAIEIGLKHGFTGPEVALAMKDFLKEKVPKSTLYDWTRPLLEEPVRKQSVRIEESSSTETVNETVPLRHVKLGQAVDELMEARRLGVLTGMFYWKGDQPK